MPSHSDSGLLPRFQENEFLPPISRWITFGGLFVLCILGAVIPIASVAKYKVTVKAQAIVRPVGELRIVQAATEGTIMSVAVQENQVVKKGDAIAIIDDSRLQTKKSQLQSNIQQAKLQLVQINAQIAALNSQIRAETDRINRTIASAQAELDRRRRDYRDREITSKAEVVEAQANLRIAQEEWQQAQAELNSTQANLRSATAALNAARSKRNRYQSVAQKGALSQDQFEEAQLAAEQQSSAVEAQKAAVEAQKQAIERLQQAVAAARARLQRAKAALNPSYAEVAIAIQGIAQAKATGAATLATLNKESQALIQQRIEIQQQLERDNSELQQVGIDLGQTRISAPVDGILLKLNLRNSSQTVRSGEEIAQIAPSNIPLVVKAMVDAQDVSKVKTGQQAQLRVSACPYPDYGTLKGVVSAISPDAMAPQTHGATATTTTTSTQKVSAVGTFYEVTIEPENIALGQGKNQCSIQLGMEGRADIISREETVLQFFLRKARLITDL